LTLEWERPLTVNESSEILQTMETDTSYDVKMFYGVFNHDGKENIEKLKGGKL